MFSNIGRKIKGLSKIVWWMFIIISALLGLSGGIIGVMFCVIIGGIIGWFSTFMLYGLGQLIENTDVIVNNQQQIIDIFNKTKSGNTEEIRQQ